MAVEALKVLLLCLGFGLFWAGSKSVSRSSRFIICFIMR